MTSYTVPSPSCRRCGAVIRGSQVWTGSGDGPVHPICPNAIVGRTQVFPVAVDATGLPLQQTASPPYLPFLARIATALERLADAFDADENGGSKDG